MLALAPSKALLSGRASCGGERGLQRKMSMQNFLLEANLSAALLFSLIRDKSNEREFLEEETEQTLPLLREESGHSWAGGTEGVGEVGLPGLSVGPGQGGPGPRGRTP